MIILIDGYALIRTGFPAETIGGVLLVLTAASVFSQIIHFKMQQAHFIAFMGLRRERAVNRELTEATDRIGALQELLPICANCKKVRDDNGYWEQLDEYISNRPDLSLSHGICPECFTTLYPDIEDPEP